MVPSYGCAALRDVRDAPSALLRYLVTFHDGGALAVSVDGRLVGWVEHDFDPWVVSRPVDWFDLNSAVRVTVLAVCMAVDAALGRQGADCEHDLHR